MANYEFASFNAGSKQSFAAIDKYFRDEQNYFGFYESDNIIGTASIRNRSGNTLRALMEISALYPDDFIHAEISYEGERYHFIHHYVVMEGKYTETNVVAKEEEEYEEEVNEEEVNEEEVNVNAEDYDGFPFDDL